MITVTPDAVLRIRDVRQKEGRQGDSLRIRVVPGGCDGFSYSIDWEKEPGPNDLAFEAADDVHVVVDKASLQFVTGLEIGFTSGLYGGGFKFSNPKAASECGCGQSFSV